MRVLEMDPRSVGSEEDSEAYGDYLLGFGEGEGEEDFAIFFCWSEDLGEPYDLVDPSGPGFTEGVTSVQATSSGLLLVLSEEATDYFETDAILLQGDKSQQAEWLVMLQEFFARCEPGETPVLPDHV